MTTPLPATTVAGPAPAEMPPGLPYVLATIGSHQIAVAMAALQEVAEIGEITSLPLTPDWLLGVSNLRGVVTPVTDLAPLLGWGTSTQGQRALVLRDGQFSLAVAVESVPAVRWLENPPAAADEQAIVAGSLTIDGRQTHLVNPDALLAHVRAGEQVGTGGR
jgi:chemotaxis signal transduction protein